jgi:hypothetical protein
VENIDKRLCSHLVLTSGFSKQNAEIAVQMYHKGELTATEKEVITKIRLNPEDDAIPIVYYKDTEPKVYVLDHLNYRITKLGGSPITPSKRRRYDC